MTLTSEPELLDTTALADPMHPHLARIASVTRETSDTVTIGAELPAAGGLPQFIPGQFSMLYAYGAGEVPISISGDPGNECRAVPTPADSRQSGHRAERRERRGCRDRRWRGRRMTPHARIP